MIEVKAAYLTNYLAGLGEFSGFKRKEESPFI
jgi:hypothetical protein